MRKVAIVYDQPSWAFHHIAIQVATHAPADLEFTLIPSGHQKSWRAFHANFAGDFDWCHYLWRGATESIVAKGAENISTAVYDHQFLDNRRYTQKLLGTIPFYVASAKLQDIYAKMMPNRVIPACPDGVDTNFFYPGSQVGKKSELHVGWVGNSTWGHNSTKGFHEIFSKSIDKAKALGIPIQAHTADASITKRTHAQMADFYQEIDVLLCTSLTEGTPNPILEASASGRAWVSTDVGIVPELAGALQRNFIIDRSVDSFVSALQVLHNDRAKLQSLGEENRTQVEENWRWGDRSIAISNFIRDAINSSI